MIKKNPHLGQPIRHKAFKLPIFQIQKCYYTNPWNV